MINYKLTQQYCRDNISDIENFEDAINDRTETWDIHHKREISENKSRSELESLNLVFNRPSNELIFLKRNEHMRIHQTHRLTKEYKSMLSERLSGSGNGMFGKHHSEESRMKMSDTRKERIANGDIVVDTSKCHTEEANIKISEKAKERLSNPENHPMFGKHQSEETKRKISEAKKGRIPWNKGKKMKKIGN